MYSVARSPPRAPTPRPSRRSLERNFTWARMRSPAISVIWADATAEVSRISNSLGNGVPACVLLQARMPVLLFLGLMVAQTMPPELLKMGHSHRGDAFDTG